MQHVMIPSLQHMATANIAAVLWTRPISEQVARFINLPLFHFEVSDKWKKMKTAVKRQASDIVLPPSIKHIVFSYIDPIGDELLDWLKRHENILNESKCISRILSAIKWTPAGQIDHEATAVSLIQKELLSRMNCFKFAAHYYLEKILEEQWDKLSEIEKMEFLKIFDCIDLITGCSMDHIYWAYYMSKKRIEYEDIVYRMTGKNLYKLMFDNSVYKNNLAGVKYFWDLLSYSNQRETPLSYFIRSDTMIPWRLGIDVEEYCSKDKSSIVNFLLSKMNDEQKAAVFKINGADIVKSYLKWPAQDSFLEMAKQIFPYFTTDNFRFLLEYIVRTYISTNVKYYDFKQLFADIWTLIPHNLQQNIVELHTETCGSNLFNILLMNDDCQNVTLLLKNTTAEERGKILKNNLFIVDSLLKKNKLDMLAFFLRQCITTHEQWQDIRLKVCSNYPISQRFYKFFSNFQLEELENETSPAKKIRI